MADKTAIEWTDATFNPWIGCTHVTDACRFCYAERDWDHRFHRVEWGVKGTRVKTSDANWKEPYRWNRQAAVEGKRKRVFCASLADIFDDHESIDPEWRGKLWTIIADTQNLDWLLLTKRPHNFPIYLPVAECRPPFEHVRLGVSIGSDKDVHLDMMGPLQFASYVGWKTFISYEPALGPIDWNDILERGFIEWLITGGESGPSARPAHPDWFRTARDACTRHGVPFLFKQWGEFAPVYDRQRDDPDWRNCATVAHETPRGQWLNLAGGQGFHGECVVRVDRIGKKRAGRLLDGVEHNGYPEAAR